MQNIDWKIYRHPRFLRSLDMTPNDRKYLNLFLKRDIVDNIGNSEDMRQTRLDTVRKEFRSSKFITQEQVGINI